MKQKIENSTTASPRVPVGNGDAAKMVGVVSDYALAGVDWDYYNTVHNFLDFHTNWPNGMAAHFAWAGAGHWRSIFLWRDRASADDYFGRVAIESISRAVQLLGAVPGRDGATDVEPERYAVCNFMLGPLARKFVNSGPDRDGEAIHALGGEPVALQLDIEGLDAALYEELLNRVRYDKTIPADLITHCASEYDGGIRITELWSGRGRALVNLGESLLPAIEQIAGERSVELPCDHNISEPRRIVFGEQLVTAFGL